MYPSYIKLEEFDGEPVAVDPREVAAVRRQIAGCLLVLKSGHMVHIKLSMDEYFVAALEHLTHVECV